MPKYSVKMSLTKYVILSINLVLAVNFSFAKQDTYYVSNSGNDSNSGSESQPWKTLKKAADTLEPGDIVLVRGGSYQSLKITRSGQKGAPITFQSYPGEIPTIKNGPASQGIKIQDADYIIIDGFHITDFSNQGFYCYRGDYIIIRKCLIYNIGREGLRFKYSNFGIAENNIIHNTGNRGGGANGEGIYVGSGDVSAGEEDPTHGIIVRNNEIYNTTDEGIELKQGTYNCIVENNLVHDCVINNGGGINIQRGVIDKKHPKHVVRNNIVFNISTRTQYLDGNGIRVGNGADVYNNIFFNNQHYGIRIDDKKKYRNLVKIYHNTLYNNGTNDIPVLDGAKADILNNIGTSQAGNLPNSVDPKFIDPQNGNFRLLKNSPAIDNGVDLGIPKDIDDNPRPMGSKPDMGAYEYTNQSNDTVAPAPPQNIRVQESSKS